MKKDVEFRLVRIKIIYCRSLNLCFAYAHIPRPDHPRGQARSIETVTVRIKQQMPIIWIISLPKKEPSFDRLPDS